jgi:hypothetical protein
MMRSRWRVQVCSFIIVALAALAAEAATAPQLPAWTKRGDGARYVNASGNPVHVSKFGAWRRVTSFRTRNGVGESEVIAHDSGQRVRIQSIPTRHPKIERVLRTDDTPARPGEMVLGRKVPHYRWDRNASSDDDRRDADLALGEAIKLAKRKGTITFEAGLGVIVVAPGDTLASLRPELGHVIRGELGDEDVTAFSPRARKLLAEPAP